MANIHTLTTAFAFAAFSAGYAMAQDVASVDPVADTSKPLPVASQALTDAFNAVCKASFILSDNAQIACHDNTLPKVLKSGESFRNSGIGSEFNTLIRQLPVAN